MNIDSQDTRLVTVYITTYNRLFLLKRAINSVLGQSYPHIEVIVADDGSTDGTHEYLEEMEAKGFLKSIINKSGASKGACFGRNNAIAMAQGYFITGLDDDDYFESWRISSFLDKWIELENTNIAGMFDDFIELTESGKVIIERSDIVTHSKLRKSNLIGNQVFTIREKLLAVGGFDEEMPAWQDWDTWLRLSKVFGCFINIHSNSYIADQTHGGERISAKDPKKIRIAYERLKNKLKPLTYNEDVALLDALYGYKQVDLRCFEIIKLICAFKFRKAASIFKRKLYDKK